MAIVSLANDDDTIGVAEYTLARLRGDIVSGTLKPGTRLRLEVLKRTYGASISTLREILNRLHTEGLVQAEGQKGFEVAPATATDLREIGELRLLLETHALAKSLADGDLDWEGRVVSAHHKLAAVERRLVEGDLSRTLEWVRYDFDFHAALISACGSRALMTMHASIFDKFIRYHMLAASFRGRAVTEDHRELFDLALARDVTAATEKLSVHIRAGMEHVLASGTIR
jgi:GntR family transcriptional regulator, carbon starvation induced regulator